MALIEYLRHMTLFTMACVVALQAMRHFWYFLQSQAMPAARAWRSPQPLFNATSEVQMAETIRAAIEAEKRRQAGQHQNDTETPSK